MVPRKLPQKHTIQLWDQEGISPSLTRQRQANQLYCLQDAEMVNIVMTSFERPTFNKS